MNTVSTLNRSVAKWSFCQSYPAPPERPIHLNDELESTRTNLKRSSGDFLTPPRSRQQDSFEAKLTEMTKSVCHEPCRGS